MVSWVADPVHNLVEEARLGWSWRWWSLGRAGPFGHFRTEHPPSLELPALNQDQSARLTGMLRVLRR